jgi:hypothetical protein
MWPLAHLWLWLTLVGGAATAYNVLDDGTNALTAGGININATAASIYGNATISFPRTAYFDQYGNYHFVNSSTGGQWTVSQDGGIGNIFQTNIRGVVNTKNSILDDGLGNMKIAGALTLGTGSQGLSPSLTFPNSNPSGNQYYLDQYGNYHTNNPYAGYGIVLDGTNGFTAFQVQTSGKVVTRYTTLDDGNGNMQIGYTATSSSYIPSRLSVGAPSDCGSSYYGQSICSSSGFNAGTWPFGIHVGGGSGNTAVFQVDANGVTRARRILIRNSGFQNPSTPDISWESDGAQDTGIYWISDGVMAFSSNGILSQRFQQNAMSIYATSNNNAFTFYYPNGQTSNYWTCGAELNNNFHVFNQASTGAYIVNGATSWSASSDSRLKSNIVNETQSTLNKLMQLRPVTFTMNGDPNNVTNHGFIAQEFMQVFPEMVTQSGATNGTAYYGIQYTQLISILIKSVQQQQAYMQTQLLQINALTSQVNSLSAKLGLTTLTNVATGLGL